MKWSDWREQARWRGELRNVPRSQLRSMVERSAFHQTPGKQQWAERWLWRRTNLYDPLKIVPILAAILGMIVGLLGLIRKGERRGPEPPDRFNSKAVDSWAYAAVLLRRDRRERMAGRF